MGAGAPDAPAPIGLITPVILSGGSGTRLWPLSRPARPKQMLALTGAETMLQLTAARVADTSRFASPIVVAAAAHAELIESQLALVGIKAGSLILEPCSRNTAPAIALAALTAAPDALLLVMPSDHLIRRSQAFRAAVEQGAKAAAGGWLVTFGIRPDSAHSGYGYIRRGAAVGPGIFRVERFVEKPASDTATAFVASGDYDWNAGIFLFRADALLAAMAAHSPDILAVAEAAHARAVLADGRILLDADAFASSRSLSIDHAVMEHAEKVAVVPVEMGWSDVGSWDALYEVAEHDDQGNAAQGTVRALETRNCLLHSDGLRLVTLGVADLIVVAAGDTVMILPRGQSERVRDLATSREDDA